ncbi:hypothetical protein BT63DRAFT_317474 [Microthyrium microscopicum]|uniref:Uncharacterized protein n=1 Tax=Microthyrium microscopicum TaxID=703497 RepID=A0A6A6U5N3_9PEZI|nr:hypothetical protein BT63DRAFT_317474 [Microthyrium microscopicum]
MLKRRIRHYVAFIVTCLCLLICNDPGCRRLAEISRFLFNSGGPSAFWEVLDHRTGWLALWLVQWRMLYVLLKPSDCDSHWDPQEHTSSSSFITCLSIVFQCRSMLLNCFWKDPDPQMVETEALLSRVSSLRPDHCRSR